MRLVLALALLVSTTTLASAQNRPADVAAGGTLAVRSCSRCHVVTEQQNQTVSGGAPSFASLAGADENRLSGFLQAPHPPLPDLALTRDEIRDVIGYIQSLRNR